MKKILLPFAFCLLPFASQAAQEGTPVYYQNTAQNANAANYGRYADAGYSKYVGQSGAKQVVGTRSYAYQVPNPAAVNYSRGAMTTNGVSLPAEAEAPFTVGLDYTRRFANFRFETGVNSILKWDDMIFNEIGANAQYNFALRDFDMFVFGEYSHGSTKGGMSMDYDLKPYDERFPNDGIFTISVGDQSGTSDHFRFGIGARHVWDIGGWKLSPSIGYEIFKHNLEMSNHIYPNPGVYLPLLTVGGEYVYGNSNDEYYAATSNPDPDEFFQVCMSPEDIKLVQSSGTGWLDTLTTGDYNPANGTVPWGVGPGECVIVGGDGPIVVAGTTHIYDTTWSGFYIGLEMEKQMTLADKLRFYIQVGLPSYSSEGTWPNRTDWQQNPSFIDEGNNGAYSYRAEMEYTFNVSDRLKLALKVDTDYFYVGKISGELYVAEYTTWAMNADGGYACDPASPSGTCVPYLITTAAHTEKISDSLKNAYWQSFGLHLGLKYSF